MPGFNGLALAWDLLDRKASRTQLEIAMTRRQKASRARLLRFACALALTVIGLIGLIIPILPGIPLLIVAAMVFSSRLPIERRV